MFTIMVVYFFVYLKFKIRKIFFLVFLLLVILSFFCSELDKNKLQKLFFYSQQT